MAPPANMKTKTESKKRKSRRKARTEVSSESSSSESDSDISGSSSSSPNQEIRAEAKSRAKKSKVSATTSTTSTKRNTNTPPDAPSSPDSSSNEDEDAESLASQPVFPTPAAPKINVNEAFEQFYLKQATREFAEDLEKLREASDFRSEAEGGKGVEMLVRGLREGVACFRSEGERGRVVLGIGMD